MKKLSFIFIFSTSLICAIAFLGAKYFLSHSIAPTELGYNGLGRYKKIDWLFIGTSRVDASYDLEAFERALGVTAYAIWLPNMSPREIELYLQHILSGDLKIGNIVIDLPTMSFGMTPSIKTVRTFYEAPPSLKWNILGHYLGNQSIPKTDILSLLLAGYNAELLTFPLNRPFIDRACYHGVRKSFKKPMTEEEWKTLKIKDRFIASRGRIDPQNSSALLRTIKLLKSGFAGNVYFIDTALARVAMDNPIVQRMKKEVSALVRAQGMTYLNMFDDLHFNIDERKFFYDDHHFSTSGKRANTELLTSYILEEKKDHP